MRYETKIAIKMMDTFHHLKKKNLITKQKFKIIFFSDIESLILTAKCSPHFLTCF